jgi:hypothetical protein
MWQRRLQVLVLAGVAGMTACGGASPDVSPDPVMVRAATASYPTRVAKSDAASTLRR